jgi:hypothetical protein
MEARMQPVPMSSAARRTAALAAFAAAAIFVTQEVCLLLAADPGSVDDLIRGGVHPVNLLRARLMFVQFFLVLTVYAAIVARTRRPVALLGLVFGLISCTLELGYRAVELEGVFARWLPAYLQAPNDAARLLARLRLDSFYDVVAAAYLVIGVAAPLTALCFGLATVGGATRLERAVGILYFANLARHSLRWLFVPLWPSLSGVSSAIFPFLVVPLYVCVGVWLWRTPPPAPAG